MGNHMPYGITLCYLPPHSGDFPAFTPTEAGTQFSDPISDITGQCHGNNNNYYQHTEYLTADMLPTASTS